MHPESVRIQYQCGYDVDVPAPITQAIKVGVRQMMSNITSVAQFLTQDKVEGVGEKRYAISQEASSVLRASLEGLLSAYRIFS